MNDERSGTVRLTVGEGVATVVLDAPERHNALEAADVHAFRAHLDAVDGSPSVRVLVVTGAGDRTFCSGASLAQMERGEMTPELFETLTNRLASTRMPSVCALNGSAYGGGAEVALCCDFRIGVRGSRLSVPAARLGVCYPPEGLRRYVSRLGLAAAQRVLVAHEELDAEEMLRVGFLTHLVEPDELADASRALASRLAGHAPLAVEAMTATLREIASGTLARADADARVARCAESRDLREGLRAQREGRPPRFEGR